ncbi:hypothetical protein, partial [Alloscardovia macacae]
MKDEEECFCALSAVLGTIRDYSELRLAVEANTSHGRRTPALNSCPKGALLIFVCMGCGVWCGCVL